MSNQNLDRGEIAKLCKSKSVKHGVNHKFFLDLIMKLQPHTEDELDAMYDELLFYKFFNSYDEMFKESTA